MTIYCENAAAAEVLFSLTGGREGRIVSYNPPVEVTTASAVLRSVFTRYEINESDDGNQNIIYTDIGTVFLELPTMSVVSGDLWSGNFQAGNFIYETKQQYRQFPPDNKVRYKRTLEKTDTRTNQNKVIYVSPWTQFFSEEYLRPLKELPNALLISDKEGVLYAQNFPNGLKPTYQVNCISCPPGLCAARGDGGKIACIDCPKVISGLNNASRRIDSIYG